MMSACVVALPGEVRTSMPEPAAFATLLPWIEASSRLLAAGAR